MLTIQTVMLVLLGFLLAMLLALMVVPAYWRRVERLTLDRVRSTMPLTEAEIRADKDRLRAEYAIKLHRLEVDGEKQAHMTARQQIELNRRDAAISGLEGEVASLRTALEGYENAHRVLEQTITQRMPGLENRLSEARKLAFQRDKELAEARERLAETSQTLEDVNLARTQQRDELFKLNSVVATYAARSRENLADPSFDAEAGLRAEVESLKAKLSDRARELAAARRTATLVSAQGPAVSSSDAHEFEMVELREALASAQAELKAVRSEVAAGAPRVDIEAQARQLRAATEDQAAEIARLKAALTTYEGGETSVSLRDTRIGMKARLGALQAERDSQVATIHRMRGELASANERLARQAQHFVAEMRRIGANGISTIPQIHIEPHEAAGGSDQDEASERRRPLAGRLSEQAAAVARRAEKALDSGPALLRKMAEQDLPRVRGFLKSLSGSSAAPADGSDRLHERMERVTAIDREAPPEPAEPRRARLVERLSDATKT